jgi:hypothetical protein
MSRTRNGVIQAPQFPQLLLQGKNEHGEWIERSSGTSVYGEAKKQKAQAEREIEEGCLPNDRSAWTLKVAVDEWHKDRKLRVSAGTYASDVTNTRHLNDPGLRALMRWSAARSPREWDDFELQYRSEDDRMDIVDHVLRGDRSYFFATPRLGESYPQFHWKCRHTGLGRNALTPAFSENLGTIKST